MRGRHRSRPPLFPLRRFMTARLHRRLFFWFAATVIVSALSVGAVLRIVELGDASSWSGRMERLRGFLGGRFAVVWDDARARDELAGALSHDLELDITVVDAAGQPLVTTGPPCRKNAFVAPVRRGHVVLGRVLVCADRKHPGWLRMMLPIGAALTVLWAASGILARRLSRPVEELARAAEALGRGRRPTPHGERSNDPVEVHTVSTVMDDLASRIQRQLEDQRALLAAVSHEIRTPLARLRLLVEMTRDKLGDDKLLDDMDREVVDVDALVSELLASSRLDFAALSPKLLPAERVAKVALERAGLPEGLLRIEAPGLAFQGDPTLVDRAVGNLLRNGESHGRGVEALRVIARDDGTVAFEVDDRGPGFPPGEEERVFRPFHRVSADAQGSLGLGLSLVKRIAEAHGGRAYAQNRPGGGATVGVTFSRERRDAPS